MVEKFFLALDYDDETVAVDSGLSAADFIRRTFGDEVKKRIGMKLNSDLLAGASGALGELSDNHYEIFADLKVSNEPSVGEGLVRNTSLRTRLPFRYVTISGSLGHEMLSDYLLRLNDMSLIAYTVHTKIGSVPEVYGAAHMDTVLLRFGNGAVNSGMHAIVLDGQALRNPTLRSLPIRKLVTGVRLRKEEEGEQRRAILAEDLAVMKDYVDYVVVSSQYLSRNRRHDLARYFSVLL